MILLLSISAIIFPISDIAAIEARQKKANKKGKEEKIGKERANKTARVKWGRRK